jgi:hypothetical protein
MVVEWLAEVVNARLGLSRLAEFGHFLWVGSGLAAPFGTIHSLTLD